LRRATKTAAHSKELHIPEGKNHSQKEKVAAEITESIVRHTGTDRNYIYVIFEDVKTSDWAAGGGTLFGTGPADPTAGQ
jgi:4-oxalocrotonate tautomerase